MQRQSVYPFTAIVGQDLMQRALVLNAVHSRIGGVLIRGERGTAKYTAARALVALLPSINVIEGCRFHNNPETPGNWCSECTEVECRRSSCRFSHIKNCKGGGRF